MMQDREFRAILRSSTATQRQLHRRLVAGRRAHRPLISRRGFVLIAAYLGVAVFSTMSVAYFNRTSTHHQLAQRHAEHLKALHYAEAGLDMAIAELAKDAEYAGGFAEVGEGAYKVSVTEHSTLPDAVIVHAEGYYPSPSMLAAYRTESLEMVTRVEPSLFNWAFFGDEKVDMPGTVMLDAYDSRLGPYGKDNQGLAFAFGTNVDDARSIVVGKNLDALLGMAVCGDEMAKLEACVDSHPDSKYAGEDVLEQLIKLPTPELPPEINYTPLDIDITGGTYTISSATPDVRRVGNVYVIAFHDVNVTGGARVVADLDLPLIVYITGDLGLSGGASVGDDVGYDTTKLNLYFTADSTISLTGSAAIYAGVYAPLAVITGSGTLDFYGAIVCRVFSFTGTVFGAYDHALAPAKGTGPLVTPLVYTRPGAP